MKADAEGEQPPRGRRRQHKHKCEYTPDQAPTSGSPSSWPPPHRRCGGGFALALPKQQPPGREHDKAREREGDVPIYPVFTRDRLVDVM